MAWMSKLQIEEKQIAGYEEGAPSANFIGKEMPTTAVREAQADLSPLCQSEGSWYDYGFILVIGSRHLDQSQLDTSSPMVDDKKGIDNRYAHVSSINNQLKDMSQREANNLTCEVSINCNEPGMIEYMALSMIGVLVILYFISFLLLGIVSIGLWSMFIRPDIPQEDGASPFWTGAFLATSAFCNNGMSLIDANMGPYQKE